MTTTHDLRQIERLWTYADVCDFLCISSAATVRGWVREGRIPHLRLGPRTVRFEPDAVRKWASQRGVRQ